MPKGSIEALTVEQLRRRCAYLGIGSINGRSLKWSRRADLLAALNQRLNPSCSAK